MKDEKYPTGCSASSELEPTDDNLPEPTDEKREALSLIVFFTELLLSFHMCFVFDEDSPELETELYLLLVDVF